MNKYSSVLDLGLCFNTAIFNTRAICASRYGTHPDTLDTCRCQSGTARICTAGAAQDRTGRDGRRPSGCLWLCEVQRENSLKVAEHSANCQQRKHLQGLLGALHPPAARKTTDVFSSTPCV